MFMDVIITHDGLLAKKVLFDNKLYILSDKSLLDENPREVIISWLKILVGEQKVENAFHIINAIDESEIIDFFKCVCLQRSILDAWILFLAFRHLKTTTIVCFDDVLANLDYYKAIGDLMNKK